VNVVVRKGDDSVFNFELAMTGTRIRLTSNQDMSELIDISSGLNTHYNDGVLSFRDRTVNFDILNEWLQARIIELEDMVVLDSKNYSFEIAVDETIQLPSSFRLGNPSFINEEAEEIFDSIIFSEIPQEGGGLDLIKVIKGELPIDRITVTDVVNLVRGSDGSTTRTIGVFSAEEQTTIFYSVTRDDMDIEIFEDGTISLSFTSDSRKTIQCNMYYDPEGQMYKLTD
jgi:hypothetical protein